MTSALPKRAEEAASGIQAPSALHCSWSSRQPPLALSGCGGGGGGDGGDGGEPAPANRPPVVDAGPDRSAGAGDVVFLSGSASDPDGRITAYQWEQTAGTRVSLRDAARLNALFNAPDAAADETLGFRLTVTDNDGLQSSDEVQVTVRRGNRPPMVDAGPDHSADAGEVIFLSGSASDPDGSIARYQWEQTGGTAVSLSGAASPNVSFIVPVLAADETLSFRLTVTDNDGASATDTVSVMHRTPLERPLAVPAYRSAGRRGGARGATSAAAIGKRRARASPRTAAGHRCGGPGRRLRRVNTYLIPAAATSIRCWRSTAVTEVTTSTAFVEVASNDDVDGGLQSAVSFHAQQGDILPHCRRWLPRRLYRRRRAELEDGVRIADRTGLRHAVRRQCRGDGDIRFAHNGSPRLR